MFSPLFVRLQNRRSPSGPERALSSHVSAGGSHRPRLHSRKSTTLGLLREVGVQLWGAGWTVSPSSYLPFFLSFCLICICLSLSVYSAVSKYFAHPRFFFCFMLITHTELFQIIWQILMLGKKNNLCKFRWNARFILPNNILMALKPSGGRMFWGLPEDLNALVIKNV